MRHLILFLCVTVILPLSAQTKVLRLPSRTSGTNYADQVPTRTVSRDSTGMTVEYEIPTAISYADDLYEGTNCFDESDVTTIDTSSLKSGQYFVCLMQNGVKLDSKTLIVK
jgi:hypothetical protein